MVNKVILVGYLGKDPEIKFLSSGKAVCNFSIATTEKYKDGEEHKELTEWHKVVAWGKLAEACAEYLSKGRQVYIEGSLKTTKWTDKQEVDHWSTDVIVKTMHILSDKK